MTRFGQCDMETCKMEHLKEHGARSFPMWVPLRGIQAARISSLRAVQSEREWEFYILSGHWGHHQSWLTAQPLQGFPYHVHAPGPHASPLQPGPSHNLRQMPGAALMSLAALLCFWTLWGTLSSSWTLGRPWPLPNSRKHWGAATPCDLSRNILRWHSIFQHMISLQVFNIQ